MVKRKIKTDDTSRLKNSSLIACSLQVRLLADAVADEEMSQTDNSQTKKDYFLKIASQLELDGSPKEKISKLTLLIIEERLALKIKTLKKDIPLKQAKLSISTIRHLSRTMTDAGYTDPFYSRNKKGNVPPPKPKTNFSLQNEDWIKQVSLIEMFCKKFKAFLNNNDFESLLDKDESEESLRIFNALIEDSLESINNKTKIQKYHQYLLYECFMVSGINNLSSMYSVKFKEYQNTTAKQLRKVLTGKSMKLLDIFCPKNSIESTKLGFSGNVCDHCDSLRTVYEKEQIYCYQCHGYTDKPETKLPMTDVLETD